MTQSSAAGIADVEVVVRGDVPAAARAEAERKITSLARYVRQPITHARIRLTRLGDPAVPRPVIAQGNLNVHGRLVRAQVAAHTPSEAVDLLQAKLRHRLTRLVRHFQDRRGALPGTGPHEWRHGQEPTHRPAYFPRPAEKRQVVRHKADELARATPDGAAFDMGLTDYDFHLFTDLAEECR